MSGKGKLHIAAGYILVTLMQSVHTSSYFEGKYLLGVTELTACGWSTGVGVSHAPCFEGRD